ncbi:hypothetical protein [Actinomadura macra]|uniref:hypothetical protein n=1 Tax=Actinomadura macra TaxID=46164 RepID=UPI000834713C|nr:hypothetical protein [Actinomadura macra]
MEPDILRDAEPAAWRVRRWAAPVALAVLVATAIGGVRLAVDESGPPGTAPPHPAYTPPRFMIAVGRSGAGSEPSGPSGPAPFFQVHEFRPDGRPELADSVRTPPSAGAAQEIIEGPRGAFVVVSSTTDPCESRFYGFRLTSDGHVKDLAPLRAGTTPGLVAGTAVSPDGQRIAYATAPCAGDLRPAGPPRATVTVLDTGTGRRRTWGMAGDKVVGHIVWAADGRTLGYSTSDIVEGTAADSITGETAANAAVRALDTGAPGTDLSAGRPLFRVPAGGWTVTTAVMAPDGRTGYGVMRRGRPATTVLFTFEEGREMRITKTYRPDPNKIVTLGFVSMVEPRHACLTGPDAFGRVIEERFEAGSRSLGRCGTAMVS